MEGGWGTQQQERNSKQNKLTPRLPIHPPHLSGGHPVPCQQDGGHPVWPDAGAYMALAHPLAVPAPDWQRGASVGQLMQLSHQIAVATDRRECTTRARVQEQEELWQRCQQQPPQKTGEQVTHMNMPAGGKCGTTTTGKQNI